MKKPEGNLDQLERDLFRVQKSTKTLFAPFIPVHNWLRMHSKWYYNWHLHEYAKGIHLGALVVYVVIVSIVIRNHFVVVSYAAGNTITQTSQADFTAGTADSNVDLTSTPGDVGLKNDANPLTQTPGDFNGGDSSGNFLTPATGVTLTTSGLTSPVADSWGYTTSSSPVALSPNPTGNVYDAYYDPTHHRLYLGILSGVEIIDTKGTPDPSDDAVVGTFNHSGYSQFPAFDTSPTLALKP